MSTVLGRLFKVTRTEAPAVGLNLLQSVFLGIPRLFTLTVGGALFLEHYAADNLPFVYLAASLLLPVVGAVHLFFERRVSFVRLQLGTLAVIGLVTGGFLILCQVSQARWPALALFVWSGTEFQLSSMVLWSTANRVFTVRQGKRLFGLIGSGEIISAIIGGALTPVLTRMMGTPNLLALSLIGAVLAFGNFLVLARVCGDRLLLSPKTPGDRSGDERRRRQESFTALFRSSYLGLIFLTYSLIFSVSFFLNNVFYFELGQAFSSTDRLAGFLGRFFAVLSFLSLIARSLLSGRLLLRFGLGGGLLVTPLVLLVGAAMVVGFGWSQVAVFLFWCVVMTRLSEKVLVGSFGQPAYYMLYQPLSRERRARVQTTAETITGPLAGGLTGLLLLFLNKGLGLTSVGLSAALLPVLAVWIAVAIAASREYRTALTSALTRRGLSGSDLTLRDPTSLRILERGLDSHRPLEVLYCLRLLEEAEHPRFHELLLGLTEHPSPLVRTGVAQLFERARDPSRLALLSDRLAQETDSQARAALLRAVGATGGTQAAVLIAPHLAAGDETTRRGALVALIRYCPTTQAEQAAHDLQRLVDSTDPGERIFAATTLQELPHNPLRQALRGLLADADLEVRRATLQAVGGAADPEIWRLTIANLESPVRGEALRTLLQAGEAALTPLGTAFADPASSRSLRRLILQIYGRSGVTAAVQILVEKLSIKDRGLLAEALWSLHLYEHRATGAGRPEGERCLQEEVCHGSRVLGAFRDLSGQPGLELLTSALAQELGQSRKRIILLLSFLYDSETLMKIWSNFGGPPAQRDLALELLETRIDKHHAALVMPVLTGRSSEPVISHRERVRQLLLDPPFWTSSWIAACAIDAIISTEGRLSAEEWARLEASEHAFVSETARFFTGSQPATTPGRPAPLPTIARVRILKGVSIFREIDDEVLAELAQRFEEVRVEPGHRVFEEGDLGRSMYIVISGCLRLQAGDEVISELKSGEIFGELSALEAEARTESATAIDASHLFRLSDTDLHAFMASRIEVVRGIIAVLCHRVRVAPTDKLADKEEKERAAAQAEVAISVYGDDYLSSLEKVLILKTAQIFSEVGDEILAEVAARAKEVRLKKNEVLFHKGDPGTETYIVAAGRIRIHIGDKWIADAGERAVVGELAALSSEPRTASVTAAEDSLLLAIDQESLFELMWDQHEIVRGIIRVLVMRLRRLRRAAHG